MNKQLTKKSIGIAASAALMASLAFSGSALAGKPEKGNAPKGSQTSVDVYSNCNIVGDQLVVNVTVTDKNAGTDKTPAELVSVSVQPQEKIGPRNLVGVGDAWKWTSDLYDEADDKCDNGTVIKIGDTCTISFSVCEALSSNAKALDALTTVDTGENGSKVTYTSMCKDSDLKLDAGSC